ncbi:NGG1p interacting factor NIF3 [Natronospirillum operosum]|uniref:NGG1p interacting factor NIF3 n=1 Tax=Natronospirillum operosum TaxID=2759953 RepID=A0A4Z0WAZ3_9GAMM|nr:NGG1p interacting factor NIF3 [Natronospirillum operosum]TGG95312.1 NGG1p interacting factor NIF3 [Natronospirillum operosum]
MTESRQYKLIWFVPETHATATRDAVFEAGAGRQGDYEHCAWQCLGQGQFKPNADANPYLGEADRLEEVVEYRIETLVPAAALKAVIAALRRSHPYEEPAFEVIELVSPAAWE